MGEPPHPKVVVAAESTFETSMKAASERGLHETAATPQVGKAETTASPGDFGARRWQRNETAIVALSEASGITGKGITGPESVKYKAPSPICSFCKEVWLLSEVLGMMV